MANVNPDSYLGQIGNSFYAGPNGQSFEIKYIFPNKKTLNNDIAIDLKESPVQMGDYAIVSYGDLNTTEYNNNKEEDNALGYYNATLWQKYLNSGQIAYKLITSFQSARIGLDITSETTLDADENPYLEEAQDSTLDNVKYILHLPKTYQFEATVGTPLAAGADNAIVDIDSLEEDGVTLPINFQFPQPWDIQSGQDSGYVNPSQNASVAIDRKLNPNNTDSDTTKYLHIKIPNAWDIGLGSDSGNIDPGQDANVIMDQKFRPEDADSDTTKYLHIKIPNAWDIQLGKVESIVPGTDSTDLANPEITLNQEDKDGIPSNEIKYVHFKLPKVWDIQSGQDSGYVNPSQNASVEINRKLAPASDDSNTTKYIHIKIPNAWNFQKGNDSEVVNPGVLPSVEIDQKSTAADTDSNTTKYIHFKLPKAWGINLGKVEIGVPGTTPEVTLNQENADGILSNEIKYVHFKLPASQKFTTDSFEVESIGPTLEPTVALRYESDDVVQQYPKVELSLPRPAITRYGLALATTANATINRTGSTTTDWAAISDLLPGDMYVNTTYAAVHRISTKTTSQITTEYLGSMQLNIPTLNSNPINPYDTNGNPIVPTITTNTSSGPVSTWAINVDTVTAPIFQQSADSGFVASTATGTISSRASGNTVTYTFKIPKGTKITTYNEQANIANVSKVDGDLYLDSNGQFFRYSSSYDVWQRSTNIKGTNGKNFSVKTTLIITADDLETYSGNLYEKMGAYVTENYPEYVVDLKEYEMLNISYSESLGVTVSHWLFLTSNGTWSGSKLTGDISNSIVENTWQTSADDDRAYSVTRINELRNTIASLNSRIAVLEDMVEKAWGALPVSE